VLHVFHGSANFETQSLAFGDSERLAYQDDADLDPAAAILDARPGTNRRQARPKSRKKVP
jgi:hypothetical protein